MSKSETPIRNPNQKFQSQTLIKNSNQKFINKNPNQKFQSETPIITKDNIKHKKRNINKPAATPRSARHPCMGLQGLRPIRFRGNMKRHQILEGSVTKEKQMFGVSVTETYLDDDRAGFVL